MLDAIPKFYIQTENSGKNIRALCFITNIIIYIGCKSENTWNSYILRIA